MYSHLQFDIDLRPEIIHAKELWKRDPDLYRLDNPDLQNHKCLKSGSAWTDEHLQAFHIIPILNLEIHNVLPQEFIPDDEELTENFHLFWSMDRDDIYDENWEKFYKIDPDTFAKTRATISSTLENLMTLVDRRRNKGSDLSSTSDEGDVIEIQTWIFSNSICRAFLNILNLHQKTLPSWDYVTTAKKGAHYSIKILNSVYGQVRNDGAIVHVNANRSVSPFIWVEVKSLEYAPLPKTENAYMSKIPQKAAEALSFAQSYWKKAGLDIKDQESFGMEFNHRYASFWHVLFPKEYLLDVYCSKVLNHTHVIALKRSRVFDLIESEDRKEFARCLVGLLNYMSKGNPLIGNY